MVYQQKRFGNSDGFSIDLIGEPDSEAIKWIWTNRKSLFDDAYPDCSINLKIENNKPYAISVKVLDIPIEELIKMEPKNKWEYGEVVYGEEHKFSSIADQVIDDFDKENEVSKKTAVA